MRSIRQHAVLAIVLIAVIITWSCTKDPIKPGGHFAPEMIMDLTVSDRSETSLIVEWAVPAVVGGQTGQLRYEVRYSAEQPPATGWYNGYGDIVEGDPIPASSGDRLSIVCDKLDSWKVYYVAVKAAVNESEWSAWSNVAVRTDLAVGVPGRLTTNQSIDLSPSWSPDGKRIAFASYREGNSDVWLASLYTGDDPVQLTSHAQENGEPKWSPDGTRIAFTSTRSGNSDIWVVSLDGEAPKRLTFGPTEDRSPSWSPDGFYVVYAAYMRDGLFALTIGPVDGGTGNFVCPNGCDQQYPAWSPDGKWIVYALGECKLSRHLYLVSSDGCTSNQLVASTGNDVEPEWSLNNDTIAFMSDRTGNWDIWTIPAAGGAETQVTNSVANDVQPAWSPDGSKLVYSSNRAGSYDIWLLRIR